MAASSQIDEARSICYLYPDQSMKHLIRLDAAIGSAENGQA